MTRRQMRAAGLAPGGALPVAQVVCRRGRRHALLYDPADLTPKRVATPAQLRAVAAALAARRWCPACRRDVGSCIPTSLGRCVDCAFPAQPDDSTSPTSPTTAPADPESPEVAVAARTKGAAA